MGIEIRQPGEAKLAVMEGTAIGQAERAKEERARADRAAEQAAQDRARQVAQEWDLQKMMLNSQQDFAHQQRLHQADLEAEARSKEWEVQKLELRSQMDFQKKEQARQKEYDEFLATDKYINDKVASGEWTPERAEGPLFMNAYRHPHLDKPEIVARLGSSVEYTQKLQGTRTQRPASVSEQRWGLLTPEEQFKSARVESGLEPRAKAGGEEDLARERRQLEAIVGEVEMPSLLSLPDLRKRAAEIMGTTIGTDLVAPGQTLDADTARQILIEAGGDKTKARQIAKQKGYSF